MRLGVSSYTFTWAVGVPDRPPSQPLDHAGLIEKAAALGVKVVQMADNLPLDRLGDADLREVEARAGRLGIAIEVGARGIDLPRLRRYVALAERFAAPFVRLVPATETSHPSPGEVIALLRALRPDLERSGRVIALENHDRFGVRTLVRIAEAAGTDRTGICLDTVNSFGALEGPKEVVETLAPLTVNLHVKDFAVVRANHQMGFTVEGRPAGKGMLDIPWLLGEIAAHGRDPNAIIELWTQPEASLEATIAKEEQWAAESIEFLRRFVKE